MSRRLIIGLLILILALGVTVWSLVLIREEPLPPTASTAQRPATPDEVADPTAEEKRSAAAIANNAGTQTPALPVLASTDASSAPPQNQSSLGLTETPAVTERVVPASPPPVGTATVEPKPAPAPPVMTSQAQVQSQVQVVVVPPQISEPRAAAVVDAPVPVATPPAAVLAAEPAATNRATQSTGQGNPTVAAVTPPPPPPAPRRIAPSFDVVRVAADGSAVIAGRAEPGAVVTVLDGTREIGRVTADARGEWVLLPTIALTSGTRELSLLARGPGDIPEVRSERIVVLAVPERQQAAISTGALAVAVVRAGNINVVEPSRALQIPSAKPAAGLPLALESVDYDSGGNSVLGGRAPVGALLRVYVDGRAVGDVTADADGRWQLIPESSIAPGVHTLRVDQLAADGRVVQRIELPFSRAEPTVELASTGDKIIVQPGNSLRRIARRIYGVGTQYSVIYQANRTMIRDPDMIYPGQILAVPNRN